MSNAKAKMLKALDELEFFLQNNDEKKRQHKGEYMMDKKFLGLCQIENRTKLNIKNINFSGDNLIAAENKETGKIYTGVSYICKGIGFSKDQKDRQVKNIQVDEVLKRGCVKFDAGVIDPNNEVLGIELEYLPLWLAKISITPKM